MAEEKGELKDVTIKVNAAYPDEAPLMTTSGANVSARSQTAASPCLASPQATTSRQPTAALAR